MDLFSLPRPLGFVLGGGGSLGAVQVGMLRALAERDLFPDLVVGTSVGCLNGAVVALDPSGAANRLSRIWPRITRQMVFPGRSAGTASDASTGPDAPVSQHRSASAHPRLPGREHPLRRSCPALRGGDHGCCNGQKIRPGVGVSRWARQFCTGA
jgi:hypothetical protein